MRAKNFEPAAQRPWWLALLLAVFMALLSACSDSPAPAPTISVQPNDASAVAGTAATLSVTAAGPDITYQWQVSTDGGTTWSNVAGATQASYTTAPTTLADSGKRYRVVVTAAGISVNSSAVQLTVTPAVVAPAVTVQPAAQTATAPDAATFSVTASGTSPTYQWQRSTDGGTTFANIAGATAASYSTGATDVAMNGHQFRVVVSNGAGSVTSSAVALTVNPAPVAAAFTTQPANQSVTAGSAAAFTVVATGTPAPTLQWQRSTDGGATFANIAGATDPTYNTGTTTLSQNGERYRAVATNGTGSATSNAATLTVDPVPQAPVFTTQPTAQTVTAPAAATFTAAASGVPTPTLQWQLSTDGGTTFANINGATSGTYTTPATTQADSGKRYRVIATNSAGSRTSTAVALGVLAPAAANQYEGFAYPMGERLNGQNGGTGWSGPWNVTDGNGVTLPNGASSGDSGFIVTGLRYTDTAGNELVTSGGAWQTDPSVFYGQARRASAAGSTGGAAGTTRWISFLVKQAATTSGNNYAAVAPGTGYGTGAPAIMAGIGGSGPINAFTNCFYCSGGGSQAAQAINGFGAGSVALVVLEVMFNANPAADDTVRIWVNPSLQSRGGPLAQGSGANFAEVLSGMTLIWGDNRSFTFDELRVGDSFAAVTPYLPPSGAGTTVLALDFESALPSSVDPGTATLTGVQGYAGLGPTGNAFGGNMLRSQAGNVVTITLTDLPAHQWLSLDFLFAAIDSLDGTGTFPAGDFFRVTVDGVDVFRESFANATTDQVQSYVPPSGVELARRVDLGFSGPGSFYTDSAYWMGGEPLFRRIPHTASSVTITFRIESTGSLQDINDESWGIDNLRILVGP
jgi:hypothetical protein